MDNLNILQIKNEPVDSNCYVIFCDNSNKCLVIDPGTQDCHDLLLILYSQNLIVEHILLTHEHFDHIWGVNKLMDVFRCSLICSLDCSSNIVNKKKNLSFFYDTIGFESNSATHLIEELNYQLWWNEYCIELLSTKGHSEGSICIIISGNIFTGDTLIKNKQTIVKLPGGNKKFLSKSLMNINAKVNDSYLVHPGHGESFAYSELKTINK